MLFHTRKAIERRKRDEAELAFLIDQHGDLAAAVLQERIERVATDRRSKAHWKRLLRLLERGEGGQAE